MHTLRATVSGDSAFLAELIATFLDESPGQVETLRAATAAGDVEATRRVAHTLKSNAATFGITRLEAVCRELEARASEGELNGADDLVQSIDDVLAEARPALLALSAEGAE